MIIGFAPASLLAQVWMCLHTSCEICSHTGLAKCWPGMRQAHRASDTLRSIHSLFSASYVLHLKQIADVAVDEHKKSVPGCFVPWQHNTHVSDPGAWEDLATNASGHQRLAAWPDEWTKSANCAGLIKAKSLAPCCLYIIKIPWVRSRRIQSKLRTSYSGSAWAHMYLLCVLLSAWLLSPDSIGLQWLHCKCTKFAVAQPVRNAVVSLFQWLNKIGVHISWLWRTLLNKCWRSSYWHELWL